MLKEKWMLFIAAILLTAGICSSLLISRQTVFSQYDPVYLNRIVRYAEQYRTGTAADTPPDFEYQFTILNQDNQLLYQSAPDTARSLHEATAGHYMILDLNDQGTYLGKVLINTALPQLLKEQIHALAVVVILLFTAAALLILGFFFHFNYKVLRPFQQLNKLASNIAAGNLDLPLAMDQNNLFGAFTASLDLLREELQTAKRQEALANKSKKELVASLSHDVKTPITSIKLISELLEVTTPDQQLKEKIHTIYQKADQIDHLVTNLFQASLEELGQLQVSVKEMPSTVLTELFLEADYYHLTSMNQIPACLIKIDPLRMQQVIDNIINNSVKYANTAIEISFQLVPDFLSVTISDFGPGVDEAELPLLFQKYFRGHQAIASAADGSGIGLYLSAYLMEQMGGSIACFNHHRGFSVRLLIALG